MPRQEEKTNEKLVPTDGVCPWLQPLASALPPAATQSKEDKDSTSAADNTETNKQHSKEMTADQQSESTADRKLSQQIRKAIVKDKSLSQYAHNVKIITRDGAVTLKGPVRSEKEKKAVEKAAAQVAGKAKSPTSWRLCRRSNLTRDPPPAREPDTKKPLLWEAAFFVYR